MVFLFFKHMYKLLIYSLIMFLFYSCNSKYCLKNKGQKLNSIEFKKWEKFGGNLDSINIETVKFCLKDFDVFGENPLVRISLDSKYVYWGETKSNSLKVNLPNQKNPDGFYLLAIELIDRKDSLYYHWSSDNSFYLSKKKINYIEFLCLDKEESVRLSVSN